MSVGQVQLYNQAFSLLAADANTQWDAAASTSFTFILAASTYTPADTHTTVANLGVADTDWIQTGDGAPIVVPTRSITSVSGATRFLAGNANFGSSVTVTAKYLVCIEGDTTVTSTDNLLWYQDLSQEGGSASSSTSDFVVQAPANSIWFQINAQA